MDQQVTSARAVNDRIDGELRTLASHYRIDAIRTSQGRRVPASADEQARLDAYEAARARLAARRVVYRAARSARRACSTARTPTPSSRCRSIHRRP